MTDDKGTANLLEETEMIEHTVSIDTLQRLANLTAFLKNNPQVLQAFRECQE